MKDTEQQQVTAHIQTLEPVLREIIETIRQIILHTGPLVGERIKWNNPSFYYTGEMAGFDPKEYKRDIAVFNLFKGRIMLVLPSGGRLKDTTGLLEGDYKDGRRTILFQDMPDVMHKKAALQNIIKEWLSSVDA